MTIDELRAKIAAELAARDDLIENANKEIVFRNGRIAMLQEILAEHEAAERLRSVNEERDDGRYDRRSVAD